MNRVEVAWLDSCRTVHDWTAIEDVKPVDLEPSRCCSVGYLLSQDSSKIVLAAHSDPGEGNVLSVMVIPRACVQSVTLLRDDTTELA